MVFTPAPARAGENTPLETPGPEYVPPAGKPPVSTNGAVVKQTVLFAGHVGLLVTNVAGTVTLGDAQPVVNFKL